MTGKVRNICGTFVVACTVGIAVAALGPISGARAADYTLVNSVNVGAHAITCNFATADTSYFTFDISLVEPDTGKYLLADSSHGRPSSDTEGGLLTGATDGDVLVIDINNPSSGPTFMLPPKDDPFAGRRCDDNTSFGGVPATGPNSPGRNEISGPNGALLVNDTEVWVGDGPSRFVPGQTNSAKDYATDPCDSSVRVFSLRTGQETDHINLHGCFRTDEGTFDPIDQIVLIANPSEQPSVAAIDKHARTINNSAYVNLISARDDRDGDDNGHDHAWDWDNDGNAHHQILAQIPFDGTNGTIKADAGIEQAVYLRQTGYFYISIPGTAEDPNDGYMTILDPRQQKVLANIKLPGCAPSGNALGPNATLMLGCGDYVFAIDLSSGGKTGTLTAIPFPNPSETALACDETTYDIGSDHWGSACLTNTSKGAFDLLVVDGHSQTFDVELAGAPGAHSVAADPVTQSFWLPAYQGVCGASTARVAEYGFQ